MMKSDILLHRIHNYLNYLINARSINTIHSPFLFQFISECFNKNNSYYCFNELNTIRKLLLNNHQFIKYQNIGDESFKLKKNKIKVKDIVKTAVSPSKYSELYFRINLFLKAQNVLELGTSVGINTMYLARSAQNVISIEGQNNIYQFANRLFQEYQFKNIQLINDNFDHILPQIIQNQQFDLALIDGNHTYSATLKYYSLLKKAMKPISVIIIDDIYWNKEMTKVWKKIKEDHEPRISVDLYRCGIIIFNPNILHQQHFTLLY